MSAVLSLIGEAKRAGIELRVVDGALKAIGPEMAVDEFLPRIRPVKAEVIDLLKGGTIKDRHARLCSLLDEVVKTRHGTGRIWQVFAERIAVVISPDRLTFMNPADVILV